MNKYNLDQLARDITKNYKNKEIEKILYNWLLWIFEIDDFLEDPKNDTNLRLQIINDLINHQNISNHKLVNDYNTIYSIIKNNFQSKYFEKRMFDYLDAVKKIYIDVVINLDITNFLHLRLFDSGAYIIQSFIEFELNFLIPDDLLKLVCTIITLTNDIYSYKKEMNNDIISNYIIYLIKINGQVFDTALKDTRKLLISSIDKFYTYKNNQSYKLLEQLIEANINWHEITYRYANIN